MTPEEYMDARKSTEWQIEELQMDLNDMEQSSPRYVLYATTIATLEKELEELDARFVAH